MLSLQRGKNVLNIVFKVSQLKEWASNQLLLKSMKLLPRPQESSLHNTKSPPAN